ncbi:thiopeptide-type bacteriocin biosynthesis protein [Streptacidiphilus sp. P02-A3a]|uniref:thiopeptide-type bacteriocin biosynthesis protein n=1 Tax=Streptacidiphilus sp. P02-A3a TaxID=2704468 RepID=UPI0015FE6CF5|nr:thiopeptide-type bacteriocin biosynthesis protein [Streptacidiphilus sp. P02-A3a]QMU68682.1 hypothetical protein GXP74_11015 [Streptacidiphilus sp. P02-A3a]
MSLVPMSRQLRAPKPSGLAVAPLAPAPPLDQWLWVKLYGPPERQTEILTGHLSGLWESRTGRWAQWWFDRCCDPDDHLRLRVRVPRLGRLTGLVERVTGRAEDLHRLGLVEHVQWGTCSPEAELAAAEEVFAADSRAAVAELRSGLHQQVVTAASLLNLVIDFMGDADTAVHWVNDHLDRTDAAPVGRDIHDQALQLASPEHYFSALRATAAGPAVEQTWLPRFFAVHAYRQRLDAQGETGLDAALASLLHTHHLRVFGNDAACERTCYQLARSAAQAWIARR